jgi:hypothetical protein
MGRPKGSQDAKQRTRATKPPADKKKDAEAKSRKKASDAATERARNVANFRASLLGHSNPPAVAAPAHPDPTVDNDAVELRGIPCWTEQVNPEEITAELDYNLEEEDDEYNDADADTSDAPATSVMNTYLQAIQTRLKYEVLEDTKKEEMWLTETLNQNDWWIRHQQAESLCKKVDVIFEEIAYYRDVYVWLPEKRWGHIAWPPCPSCFNQDKIGAHGWQTNHYARRVVTMNSNYFVMSRRYICHRCNQDASTRKSNQVTIENSQKSTQIQQVSFMGYNPTSRCRLPFGLGEYFPAFFTHIGAVDLSVIDMMRAFFDKGVRPESFAETMLELHSKKHIDDHLRREFAIEQRGSFAVKKPQMFSSFADKTRYAGLVPTGKYLGFVYKRYHETIESHMSKEVKKQPTTRFHIDASYKEAKHLAQFHGHSLFKALITVTNEHGAIRCQFHTVTDGHDQMESAISAFVNTATEYGQALPELAATDNPSRDLKWLLRMIPTLQQTQDKLDRLAGIVGKSTTRNQTETPQLNLTSGNEAAATAPHALMGTSTVSDIQRIRVAASAEDVRHSVLAVREIVSTRPAGDRVMALDAEWDTKKNSAGRVVQSFKTALIQIGYRDSEERMSTLLLQVFRHQKLPQSLLSLFGDPEITFVGASVSGDLKRIGKDFECTKFTDHANYVNLGSYARKRDVVQSGTASLEKLVQLTLGEILDKSPAVRLSRWSEKELSSAQKKYAALDAMKSLEVYEQLHSLKDLTLRLSAEAAVHNLEVDIVPSHGNVASMATRAGVGSISDERICESPDGILPKCAKQNAHSRVIRVTSVLAPLLCVPGYKFAKGRGKVCLQDFGAPPFFIVLTLKMLKDHVDSPSIRIFSHINPSAKAPAATCTEPTQATRQVLEHDVLDFSETDERKVDEAEVNDGFDDLEEEDALRKSLSSEDIDLVGLAGLVGDQAEKGALEFLCEFLDDSPANIKDIFSACLGDPFHGMDRPKVSVKQEYKKPYYVALQAAFFAWRPELLAAVKETLAAYGFSKEDIDAKMYYDVDFFRERVDRRVLPPRELYWRVRAVFAVFGNKVDSKTGKPLFNARAWKKANNVLKEILLGYYSDPPGFSFYTNRLDKKGEPMVDKFGIAILDCNRGTNDVEAIHKQLVALYGTWCTGVEMSDALLSERRHRYNQRINERKRLGFPKIGHYDTWKIDAIQLVVEKNHGVLLYPDWSNASDYKETAESFGTVALHSRELHEALGKVEIADDAKAKFTGEMKYLCRAMGVEVPFLPIHGVAEAKLFTRLVLELPGFDESLMAIEWCKHVNGTTIFPKLPVYLRIHYERWERNQRVKDAVKNTKTELQMLQEVNDKHMLLPIGIPNRASAPDEDTDDFSGFGTSGHIDDGEDTGATHGIEVPDLAGWVDIAAATPMSQPNHRAIRPHEQLGQPIVGGLLIGLTAEDSPIVRQNRKRGHRGKDAQSRNKRSCARCLKCNGTDALICAGRVGNKGQTACQFFTQADADAADAQQGAEAGADNASANI